MFFVLSKKNALLLLSLSFIFLGSALFYGIYNKGITANVYTNTVIIDPGHGGEDGGAIGVTGTCEKDLNLAISKKLKEKLLNSGFNVVMTREDDKMLLSNSSVKNRKREDLKNRVKISELHKKGIFLSIHMNFFDDKAQKGAQVFYSKKNENGKKLSELIQSELVKNLDPNNKRKSKAAGSEIYLLSHIDIPACLIECGFLSNPSEEQLLKDELYQWKIADSISQAVINYISE